MVRWIKWSHVIAVLMLVGVGAWMATGDVVIGGQSDSGNGVKPPAQRVADAVAKPFRVRVETFQAQQRQAVLEVRGRTEADFKVTVRAETAGIIKRRPVREGDIVKVGDSLCILDLRARESRLLQAKAALTKARVDLVAAVKLRAKGYTAQNRVTALKAAQDAAKAAYTEAQWTISRTRIVAPIAGIVHQPVAEIGAVLRVGDPCVQLVNTNPMLIVGQVSERNIGLISVGMKATARVVTGERVSGKIRFISPVADASTRTFHIEIEVDNSDGGLRDGVTASATIPLQKTRAHLFSPAVLALADDGQVGVRTIADGNVVRFLPVKLLADSVRGIWVAGLPEEVTVITTGHEYVIDGQVVDPVGTPKPETAKQEPTKQETGK
jgi:multidrug efflux system membrane fusion protein